MNDVTAETLKELERIFGDAHEPRGVEVEGVTLYDRPLIDPRKKEPEPDPVVVHTLAGLIGYLESDVDALDPDALLVHVVSPNEVVVRSELRGHFLQRRSYVQAVVSNLAQGFLNSFHGIEEFIIGVQSRFSDSGDRARVLKVAGNLTDEAIRTHEDDGVTQSVSARAGLKAVEGVEELPVPNPVRLAPYRTFPEVEQPASDFVLRIRKGHNGPEAALIEADGGAWKVEAIDRIGGWIGERLGLGHIIS